MSATKVAAATAQAGRPVEAPLWTRTYMLVCASGFLAYTNYAFLNATIALFIADLGGSATTVGLALALYNVVSVSMRPGMGRMIDLGRAREVIGVGSLLLSLGTFVYLIPTLTIVFIARVVQGAGWAGLNMGTYATVARVAPPSRRGEASGYFQMSLTTAGAVLPSVGLWILGIFGYQTVFVVAGIAALLSAVTAFCIAPPKRTRPEGIDGLINGLLEPGNARYALVLLLINTALPTAGLLLLGMFDYQTLTLVVGISAVLSLLTALGSVSAPADRGPAQHSGNVLKSMVETSALLPSSILFLMNAAYPAAVLFIPLYARAIAVEQVALFFLAQGIVSVATQGGLGRLSDKVGRVPAIALGLMGAVIGLLLLAGATNLAVLSAGGAIFMFGFGMINPALFAMVMDRAPREKLGAATATFTISFQAGKAVGSFIGGFLIAWFSFQALYVLSAVPLAAALVVLFLLRDRFSARAAVAQIAE